LVPISSSAVAGLSGAERRSRNNGGERLTEPLASRLADCCRSASPSARLPPRPLTSAHRPLSAPQGPLPPGPVAVVLAALCPFALCWLLLVSLALTAH